MAPSRVTLKIENFGPIVEGTVEFKPLTFLIGPNNSGKTYVATLLYALSRLLNGTASLPAQPGWETSTPPSLPRAMEAYLQLLSEQFSQGIEEALRQYFSVSRLSDLVRHDPAGAVALQIESSDSLSSKPLVSIDVSETASRIAINHSLPAQLVAPAASDMQRLRNAPHLISLERTLDVWASMVQAAGYGYYHSHYLPAARSGILDSWPLFASLAVRNLSRAIVRRETDIAPLSGVVGEFLQTVIAHFSPFRQGNGSGTDRSAFDPALAILEGQLLGGRVVLDDSRLGADQLLYETDSLSVPLQRVSSMVAELAAIDLWVRELVEPHDLLIIDEPESHLHPENQRLMARTLVRLVNAGVDVVAPTHSSTILHQVSNMLLASTLDEATRMKLGYTDADLISADDVAVYLFEQQEDGVHIVPVPIEPGFGIAEDEFVRVAEAIGDETFRLSFAASHQPA